MRAGTSTASLGPLEAILGAGNFSLSQSIRVRTGNVMVDGAIKARTFLLSADDQAANGGNIELTPIGEIDASGPTGGAVELDASGSVTLDGGSAISVRGMNYDDAGRGGSVTLQAGSYVGSGSKSLSDLRNAVTGLFDGGAVNIGAGSTVDLSVANDHALQLNPGGGSALTPSGAGSPCRREWQFIFPAARRATIRSTPRRTALPLWPTALPGHLRRAALFSCRAKAHSRYQMRLDRLLQGGRVDQFQWTSRSHPRGGVALNVSPVNTTDLTAFNETGTLTLVARQVFDPSQPNPLNSNASTPVDVRIDPIAGAVVGASGIAVVGVDLFDLTPKGAPIGSASAATIDATVQGLVQQDGALFAGGYTTRSKTAMLWPSPEIPTGIAAVLAGEAQR